MIIRLLLIIIFTLSSFFAYNQEFRNYESITFNDSLKVIRLLNEELEGVDLIVLGEEHFLEANVELQFELFKNLYYEGNVRHLLIEYGVTRGILLNIFFSTGNEEILRRYSHTKVDFLFYIRLKSFYDSLPKTKKFIVHGVDYEKANIGNVKYCIKKIINIINTDSIQLSENSQLFLDKYKTTNDFNGETENMIKKFLSELETNSNKYEAEFGEYYLDLLDLNRALKFDTKKAKKNKTFDELREELIYNQIISLKKRYKEGKFYCVFGTVHIPLKKHQGWALIEDFESFVTKLNTRADSPFKSKVLSILPLYKSCIPPWKKNYAKKNIGLTRSQLEELDEKSKKNVYTLFGCPNETNEQRKYWEGYYQMILINRF